MKLTAKLKLLPTGKQASSLLATLERANACCNWLSTQAWDTKTFGQFALQARCYKEARARFGLAAQMAVRAIAKVADAYALSNQRRIAFKSRGAFPYDQRILRYYEDSTLSIWSLDGRLKMPFQCGPRQRFLLDAQQGQSELIYYKRNFYIAAVCNIDDPEAGNVDEFLGVDFGVKNIAMTSDGNRFSGSHTNNRRFRHKHLRARLQRCGSRSAKRHLAKLSGKEARFARDKNHCIAKQIVAEAKRTGRGIAIEELSGIRDRIRAGRKQRGILHSWAFAQLRLFLTYKAILAGVVLVTVDPRNTSRGCSQCGHISKANRPTQSEFRCESCGYETHADYNAAVNISRAATKQPIAARSL